MRVLKLSIVAFLMASLISCGTTKTDVGQFREGQGDTYVYAKGKQMWVFWGFLPVGRTKVNTPADGNCQVITRTNLVDFLISGLTAGIVTSKTIKIKTKREEPQKETPSAPVQAQPVQININNKDTE